MNPLGITVNPAHPLPLWPHPTPTSRQKRANVSLFTCLEGGKTFPAPARCPALLQGVMASNWVWFTLVSSFRHLLQVANICVGRIFPFSLLLSLFFFLLQSNANFLAWHVMKCCRRMWNVAAASTTELSLWGCYKMTFTKLHYWKLMVCLHCAFNSEIVCIFCKGCTTLHRQKTCQL